MTNGFEQYSTGTRKSKERQPKANKINGQSIGKTRKSNQKATKSIGRASEKQANASKNKSAPKFGNLFGTLPQQTPHTLLERHT